STRKLPYLGSCGHGMALVLQGDAPFVRAVRRVGGKRRGARDAFAVGAGAGGGTRRGERKRNVERCATRVVARAAHPYRLVRTARRARLARGESAAAFDPRQRARTPDGVPAAG